MSQTFGDGYNDVTENKRSVVEGESPYLISDKLGSKDIVISGSKSSGRNNSNTIGRKADIVDRLLMEEMPSHSQVRNVSILLNNKSGFFIFEVK